ncbi:3-phosphoshikimate 1-carboxyvinyltransferase [Fulvivirga sp. RKSG066]|uniref:3-phosphoshikimate 1-carboxyvinyltransferase n=1 Tax=Fulvivirga aurantia TaxID=2529383 RepID=UPI00162AD496|nr:3-phosphoshikimate 1-carboxyvinyltransferase [Fulvivirga aurantia]
MVNLPASKSISNRVLIVNALSGKSAQIHNLSEARDTVTMNRLLKSSGAELDVLDAGTTMRFLTAYLTATNQNKVLTGTPRMCQRPIKILVEALKTLGANIEYVEKEGFPPIKIKGLNNQQTDKLEVRGDVSSQYISALLMIAPTLPKGLSLTLTGKVGSKPYIEMTLKIMSRFGVDYTWKENSISIKNQAYKAPKEITIEPDWSGASYFYSFLALSKNESLIINDLVDNSLQGDRATADLFESIGVKTHFNEQTAKLEKVKHESSVTYDFTDCPDLAQTVAVVCAAKGITCHMTGLESLKIKETDRVLALQNELAKIGAQLKEEDNQWTLIPSYDLPAEVSIATYDDHRMAMAFAPLATLMDVRIEEPEVVNKSFPSFWAEMKNQGFGISEL